MRLGIVTDIHEHVEHLRRALLQFERDGVDRVVHVGDVYGGGERFRETVELLGDCGASGVWGNHDIVLCELAADAPDQLRSRYSDSEIQFIRRLVPRLAVDDCLFTHVEPWRNLEDPAELWHLEGPPDTAEKLARSFQATAERRLFVGHFHRWQLSTSRAISEWNGERSILLDPEERYLVVVNAVYNGCFVTYDTATGELTPYRVG
jgi:hypothetical protein